MMQRGRTVNNGVAYNELSNYLGNPADGLSQIIQHSAYARDRLIQISRMLEQTDTHPAFAVLAKARTGHQRHPSGVEQPFDECIRYADCGMRNRSLNFGIRQVTSA